MRAAVVTVAYAAAAAAWLLGLGITPVSIVLGILIHLATGAAARRFWAVPLPLLTILLSLGEDDSGGDAGPAWILTGLLIALPGALLILCGIGLGRMLEGSASSSAERRPRRSRPD